MLTGCFGTSGISLIKGDYNIDPPPSINGAMRHVGKADSLRALIVGLGYGPQKKFQGVSIVILKMRERMIKQLYPKLMVKLHTIYLI